MFKNKDNYTSNIINQYRQFEKEIRTLKKVEINDSIQLSIADENDIYNKYSLNGNTKIKDEIIDYLEEQIKYISISHQVKIQVEYLSKNPSTISILQMLINDKLKDRISVLNNEITKKRKEVISFILFGIVSFTFLAFIRKYLSNRTIIEILLIICWVFIWEAVEIIFIDMKEFKNERLKLVQLFFAKYIIK